MELTDEKLGKLKKFVREEYSRIGSMRCPLFNEKIFFSS